MILRGKGGGEPIKQGPLNHKTIANMNSERLWQHA